MSAAPTARTDLAALRRVARLVRPERRRILAAVLVGALATGASIGLLATSGWLIARASEQPPVLLLGVAIVGVRFFGISRSVLRYLERLVAHDATFRVLARLRVGLFARIEPLVPGGLGLRPGDVLARFVDDVDALQQLVPRAAVPAGIAAVAIVGVVLGSGLVLPAAALVLAVALALGGLVAPALAYRLARGAGRRQVAARADVAAELLAVLDAAPELVAYGREAEAAAGVRAASGRLREAKVADAHVAGLGEAIVVAAIGAAVAGVLAAGAAAAGDGALGTPALAALVLLALAAFEPVRPLPAAARQLGATAAAARRVRELEELPPAVTRPAHPAPLGPGPHRLALRGATVLGAGGRPIVDRVDLDLPPGRRVGIVGPSGAGKTTLAHLLVRFRDPDGGAVLLDGRDAREHDDADVRRVVALAAQDAHVFNTTLRENVRLARPDADDAAVEAALAAARAADWAATLPDGLDTLLGEDGGLVSGGERQRIAIARALLRDAPVLVLDEPTQHLDAATAAGLMEDALRALDGRTVVLITHRPEGLAAMDEVVLLDAGRVVARGTHGELLAAVPRYAALVRAGSS